MSKREEPGSDIETSPKKQMKIEEDSPPPFNYEATNDAERLLVRQINAQLAVLEDQLHSLDTLHPVSVEFAQDEYTYKGSEHGGRSPRGIYLRFNSLEVQEIEFSFFSLEPRTYTWLNLVQILEQAVEPARLLILQEIRQRIEDKVVTLGPLHKARLKMEAQLVRLNVRPPPTKWERYLVHIAEHHGFDVSSKIRPAGDSTEASYEKITLALARFLANFELQT